MSQPQLTITATLQAINGAPPAGGKMRFTLANYGPSSPMLTADGELLSDLVKTVSFVNGQMSTPLWGNDTISPAGTFYFVQTIDANGNVTAAQNYVLHGTGIIDISGYPPLVEDPATGPTPTGTPGTAAIAVSTSTPTTPGIIVKATAAPTASGPAQHVSGYFNPPSTTSTLAYPEPTQPGSTLIAFLSGGRNDAPINLSDSLGNIYTLAAKDDGLLEDTASAVYVCAASKGGITSVTVTYSDAANNAMVLLEYVNIGTFSSAVMGRGRGDVTSPIIAPEYNLNDTGSVIALLAAQHGAEYGITPSAGFTVREALLTPGPLDVPESGWYAADRINIPAGVIDMEWMWPGDGNAQQDFYGCYVLGFTGSGQASAVVTPQSAPLIALLDPQGNLIGGFDGAGQLILSSTPGLPTNNPHVPALAWDSVDKTLAIFDGTKWAPPPSFDPTTIITVGLDAARPAPAIAGRLYFATDTRTVYEDDGAEWNPALTPGQGVNPANYLLSGPDASKPAIGSTAADTVISGLDLKTDWIQPGNVGDNPTGGQPGMTAGEGSHVASAPSIFAVDPNYSYEGFYFYDDVTKYLPNGLSLAAQKTFKYSFRVQYPTANDLAVSQAFENELHMNLGGEAYNMALQADHKGTKRWNYFHYAGVNNPAGKWLSTGIPLDESLFTPGQWLNFESHFTIDTVNKTVTHDYLSLNGVKHQLGVTQPATAEGSTVYLHASVQMDAEYSAPGAAPPSYRIDVDSMQVAMNDGTIVTGTALGVAGRLYFATDTEDVYQDSGSAWVPVLTPPAPFDPTTIILSGTDANLPAAAKAGRLYFAADTRKVYEDTGSAWSALLTPLIPPNPAGYLLAGPDANRPAAATAGRLYFATDTAKIYQDTGSAWATVLTASGGGGGGGVSPMLLAAHTINERPLALQGSVQAPTGNIEFVQGWQGQSGNTLPAPANVGQGNSLLVVFKGGNSVPTDSQGNTYRLLYTVSGHGLTIYLASNLTAGPLSVTLSPTSDGNGVQRAMMLEYSGLSASASNANVIESAQVQTVNSPSGTATFDVNVVSAKLVLMVTSSSYDRTEIAAPAGFTQRLDSGTSDAFKAFDAILPTGHNSVAATATDEAFGGDDVFMLALLPSGSSSPTRQAMNLQENLDYAGLLLSGFDGEGRLVMAQTTGAPTAVPRQANAFAYDAAANVLYAYTGSAWVTVGASGGGGGSSAPTRATAGLTSSYGAVGGSYTGDNSAGFTVGDTGSNGNMEGLVMAYPTVPFTLVARCVPNINQNGSYQAYGLMIGSSLAGGGNGMLFGGIFRSGGFTGYMANWNPGYVTETDYMAFPGSDYWVKLQDDGTNITFSMSLDGGHFDQLWTSTKAASYLGASGFASLGAGLFSRNGPSAVTVKSWTLTKP